MSTYREMVYMVIDELKITSDDAYYTEEHIIFLLEKFRSFYLRKEYLTGRKPIPMSNYLLLCLDLIKVDAIQGLPCEGGSYLRTRHKIPPLLPIGEPKAYPWDLYKGDLAYVPFERMRYVGFNRFLKNCIYCSLAPDHYLYLTSANPQFLYLQRIKFYGIFENPKDAFRLSCENGDYCDILDQEFPIEDGMIIPIIELTVQELRSPVYTPADVNNNATDDKGGIAPNQVPSAPNTASEQAAERQQYQQQDAE